MVAPIFSIVTRARAHTLLLSVDCAGTYCSGGYGTVVIQGRTCEGGQHKQSAVRARTERIGRGVMEAHCTQTHSPPTAQCSCSGGGRLPLFCCSFHSLYAMCAYFVATIVVHSVHSPSASGTCSPLTLCMLQARPQGRQRVLLSSERVHVEKPVCRARGAAAAVAAETCFPIGTRGLFTGAHSALY